MTLPPVAPRDHGRAAAVLFVQLLLVLLGTPGLDYLKRRDLATEQNRATLRVQVGEPLTTMAWGVAAFNRNVRLPLADVFEPLQRPFRVAQLWHLYRDGPNRVRRLEVWADAELWYRSVDPEHAWLAPQLRNRRVRPMVEASCTDDDAANWRGLTRFVAARAREREPGLSRVELRCTAGRFPGTDATFHHGFYAEAPAWGPAKL